MKKNIYIHTVILILILGFSVGCEKDAPSSGAGSWVPNLPYNAKAYVSSQTCSGGRVLESNLKIDFSQTQLSEAVATAISEDRSDYGKTYCNDENTTCTQFASNTEGVFFRGIGRRNDRTIKDIRFEVYGTVTNFNVTVITKVPITDDQNKTQEVLQFGGPVTVNFPNTTCGDWGDIKCEEENPCISTPESHTCTFRYLTATTSTCELFAVYCADGYTEDTAQGSTAGESFQNVRCVENN